MNTPINYNTAKLIKEKDFDKQCSNFYTNPRCKMFGIDEQGRYYPIKNKAKNLWVSGYAATLDSKHVYYAPTIAEVVMWLYEKHRIWISVLQHTKSGKGIYFESVINVMTFSGYNSPTEAYEAAIEYTLKNLLP